MAPVLPLLAQQVPGDIAAWLIGTPVTVLAFVTWAWMTGRIHGDKELQQVVRQCDAATARAERAEADLRRIAAEDRQVLVPALTRTTDVLTRYVDKRLDSTPPPQNRPVPPSQRGRQRDR